MKMWQRLIFVLVLCKFTCAKNCVHTVFHNVNVNVTVQNGTKEQIALGNCSMSPPTLSSDAVILNAKNQIITQLPKDSVANLPKLEKIVLKSNGIELIHPNAFINLPSLNYIDLRYNEITNITVNIFNGLPLINLILDNNFIANIDGKAFKNMPKLFMLSLEYNDLSIWNNEWVTEMPQLSTLRMNGNRFRNLPEDAFRNSKKLWTLRFAENDIETIHPQAFKGLYKLGVLNVAFNKIEAFHPETFSTFNGTLTEAHYGKKHRITAMDRYKHKSISGVYSVYLHGNRLTYLPDKMLRDLHKTTEINIHSNPFQCTCYKKIMNWANEKKKNVDSFDIGCFRRSNPVCAESGLYPRTCVERIDRSVQTLFYEYFYKDIRCFGDH